MAAPLRRLGDWIFSGSVLWQFTKWMLVCQIVGQAIVWPVILLCFLFGLGRPW